MHRRLPVFLYLRDRPVLVVGGGRAAAIKIRALLRAGARVTVIARNLSPEVQRLAQSTAQLKCLHRKATLRDVRAFFALLFPLTDDEALNRRLGDAARQRGIWVGGASDPSQADFTLGATVAKGPIQVAISTSGASPTLARWLAKKVGAILTKDLVKQTQGLLKKRQRVRQNLLNPRQRRRSLQGSAARIIRVVE